MRTGRPNIARPIRTSDYFPHGAANKVLPLRGQELSGLASLACSTHDPCMKFWTKLFFCSRWTQKNLVPPWIGANV